ncbi:hypothetical protein TrLO_g224 [Triparma laevis f. longispina]|uniref:Uncharacterized protein n=1 Tax=Triparma laevis f. longispina TaxID=1714387 RepID=A0A9W7A1E8_9STRA|nr:hypothetical protein TrLO_g224 [Triparma laevis f. longispina]
MQSGCEVKEMKFLSPLFHGLALTSNNSTSLSDPSLCCPKVYSDDSTSYALSADQWSVYAGGSAGTVGNVEFISQNGNSLVTVANRMGGEGDTGVIKHLVRGDLKRLFVIAYDNEGKVSSCSSDGQDGNPDNFPCFDISTPKGTKKIADSTLEMFEVPESDDDEAQLSLITVFREGETCQMISQEYSDDEYIFTTSLYDYATGTEPVDGSTWDIPAECFSNGNDDEEYV